MSGRLRILDTGLSPARLNVATSAALLRSIDEGGPDTLRFHRYPLSCVIGRNQDAGLELDLPACQAAGIEIARRVTGGGAVVMGPGILAFDLVLGTGGRDIHHLARLAGEALAAVLREAGFPASLATPGSIEIGGRKVSGSAGRLGRRAALHQATLILDLAEAPPLSLLRRRTEAGRPTPDPRHRVTSLVAEGSSCVLRDAALRLLSMTPMVESKDGVMLRSAPKERVSKHAQGLALHLTHSFAEAFGLAPEPGELTAHERVLAEDILAREVGRDDHVLENARSIEEAA